MKISDDPWEELCCRCGLCCFEKLEDDETGVIFYTATPCRYLDVVTRQCRIYERRFDINPDCVKLTEELVRTLPWLHDYCGYRRSQEPALSPKTRKGRKGKTP